MLIYDGDCAFCTRCAEWARRRLPSGARVVAWQSLPDLAALGLTEADVTAAAYWVDRGRLFRGHRAIAASLRAIGGGWAVLGAIVALPPFTWVARALYALVARNRHRMPGGSAECKVE